MDTSNTLLVVIAILAALRLIKPLLRAAKTLTIRFRKTNKVTLAELRIESTTLRKPKHSRQSRS